LLIRYIFSTMLEVLKFLILIRVILSWLPNVNNKVVEILYTVTDPILDPIKKLLDKTMGETGMMIDLSPIVAFLLIGLIQGLI